MVCMFFVITLWHYEGFSWSQYPVLIIWVALSLIHIVGVLYANCFHKETKEVPTKNRNFKMYDLKK